MDRFYSSRYGSVYNTYSTVGSKYIIEYLFWWAGTFGQMTLLFLKRTYKPLIGGQVFSYTKYTNNTTIVNVNNDVYTYRAFKKAKTWTHAFRNIHQTVYPAIYRVRHLAFFFQLVLISWMVILYLYLIYQIISFSLPPNGSIWLCIRLNNA